ncbi:IS3 family transposase [Paenibacillus polymyxa]|uniref:IS3 family transposase n=1 Tax=Paenibacillus polymyxa TaxID=1406 RepID=UPI0012DB5463
MEAEHQVREYISFYNQSRFQKKLYNRSPAEYREAVAAEACLFSPVYLTGV